MTKHDSFPDDTFPDDIIDDMHDFDDDDKIVLRDEWFLPELGEEEDLMRRTPLSQSDSFSFTIRPFTNRHSASGDEGDADTDRFSLVSIMEPTKPDLPLDLQRLSLLWSHGNIFRAFPSPTADFPDDALPSSSTVPSTSSLSITTPNTPAPVISPSPVTSSTWSILEMYNRQSDLILDSDIVPPPRRRLPTPNPISITTSNLRSPQTHTRSNSAPSPSTHHPTKKRPNRPLPSIPRLDETPSPRPPMTPTPPMVIRGPRPKRTSSNASDSRMKKRLPPLQRVA